MCPGCYEAFLTLTISFLILFRGLIYQVAQSSSAYIYPSAPMLSAHWAALPPGTNVMEVKDGLHTTPQAGLTHLQGMTASSYRHPVLLWAQKLINPDPGGQVQMGTDYARPSSFKGRSSSRLL